MNFSVVAVQQKGMRNDNTSEKRDGRGIQGLGVSGQGLVLFNYFITSQEEEGVALT